MRIPQFVVPAGHADIMTGSSAAAPACHAGRAGATHAVLQDIDVNTAAGSNSHWSVRTLLNWLVLACLLPGVLGAAMLFLYQYREGRAQQEKDTIQTVRALVQAMDNHLLRGLAVAQALSTADSLAQHDLERFHQRARALLALSGLGTNVVLRDAQGRQLLNTAVPYGQALAVSPEPEQVRKVFTRAEPVVSDLFFGPVLKGPVVSVDVPVLDPAGRVIYSLGVGITPSQFNAILRAQRLPPGWVAAVFDSSGTIVGRNHNPEKFVGNKVTPLLRQAMQRSPEGTIEAHSQEGTPLQSSYSRSPVTRWWVAIGIPRHDLQRAMVERLSMLGAGVAALFGVALVLAWFFGGRIAQSVTALLAPALAMGSNNRVAPARVYIKEAAKVASAISRASELLHQRATTLETRERELAEAYRLARFGSWYWHLETGVVEASESIREMYGRDVPPFPEQRGTLLTEESWERVNAASCVVMETGVGYDLELQVQHGKGHFIWVNARCEAVRDAGGKVVGLRGSVQDITERKRQEEALRHSESQALAAARTVEAARGRLDAVLEATPVGIVVADAHGALVLTNAAHRQLWGSDHPAPSSVADYREWRGWWADGTQRHGLALQAEDWVMARALRGEDRPREIVEIESFDVPPVRRTTVMSAAAIRDSEGTIIGGVLAQMDISDRVRAEEALRQADRRKDEFLAMLAHELRNPLAPISAAADLLRLERLDPASVKQTSAVIARQVRHMTGLVDDLLDISRVTRGLVTLDWQKLDAARIVADAIEQVRPLLQVRRHQLKVHLPPQPAFVSGDQKRLVQVVANVLNNAVKFTPEGGELVLTVAVADDQVCIRLVDNGIGMTPDLALRAFELFAQGERTPDRSQGGLGIGLALVRSLVELHQGSVAASSPGPGLGSTFTICLPLLRETLLPAVEEPVTIALGRPQRVLKVMIVDDNEDAASMLALFVGALGHQVWVEHHALPALQLAVQQRPDVMLLDIGLPDIDGNELARRLRASPETRSALLVAVTGYSQEQDRKKALAAGFDHYCVKPLDTATLEQILEQNGSAG